ncbi:hypothetical protein IMY05_003G0113300 [Salix suchowensis]|nr:hypothetical protein IMY05_003G0113300 [Salix suchowensis]
MLLMPTFSMVLSSYLVSCILFLPCGSVLKSMFFLPCSCLCCYPVQCDVHPFCSSWILKCLSMKLRLNSSVTDLKSLQLASFFPLPLP